MNIAPSQWCRLLPAVLVVLSAGGAVGAESPEPEYRVTRRHTSANIFYTGEALQVTRDGTSLLFSKSREVSTFEVLLGPELRGDFEAEFEVEIASHAAMNIPDKGGTPVPYYGFRTTDGRFENYLHTQSSDVSGWKRMRITLGRTGAEFASTCAGKPADNPMQPSIAPGYFLFLMNDVSQLRILSGRIYDATTGKTTTFGKATTVVEKVVEAPPEQEPNTQPPSATREVGRACRCRRVFFRSLLRARSW